MAFYRPKLSSEIVYGPISYPSQLSQAATATGLPALQQNGVTVIQCLRCRLTWFGHRACRGWTEQKGTGTSTTSTRTPRTNLHTTVPLTCNPTGFSDAAWFEEAVHLVQSRKTLVIWVNYFIMLWTWFCFTFSPDVILCGWLGSKHQLTNLLYIFYEIVS